MISAWGTRFLAVLDSGKLVDINDLTDSKSLFKPIDDFNVRTIASNNSILVIQTKDDHIFAAFEPDTKLVDITSEVQKHLESHFDIVGVNVYQRVVVIKTSYGVILVENSSDKLISLFLPSTDEIISWPLEPNSNYFMARTMSGPIILFSDKYACNDGFYLSNIHDWYSRTITDYETFNIRKIFNTGGALLFWMHDGSAHVKLVARLPYGLNNKTQINLPPGETIDAAVSCYEGFFIASSERNFYLVEDTENNTRVIPIPQIPKYAIKQLQNIRQECSWYHSIFRVMIVARDLNDRLYAFCIEYSLYDRQTKRVRIIHLHFFNDKSIVTIYSTRSGIYFVSDEGHIYELVDGIPITELLNDLGVELHFRRNTFFDSDPLATEFAGQKTRSALSSLTEDID